MTVFLINRPLSSSEVREIQESGITSDEIIESPYSQQEDFTFSVVPSLLTEDMKASINRDIMNKITQYGDKKIKNKSVKELLMTGQASVWHYQKFRVYFLLRNFHYELKEVELLSEKYDRIIFYTSQAVFGFSEIKKYLPQNVELNYYSQKKKINITPLFYYFVFILLRIVTSLSFRGKKNKHIVLDTSPATKIINYHNLSTTKGNYILEYLFEKLTKNFLVIRERAWPDFTTKNFEINRYDFKKFKNVRICFGETIWFWNLLFPSFRNKLKKLDKEYQKNYRLLLENAASLNDLAIPLLLKSMHASAKIFFLKYFSYLKFFKKQTPRSVSAADENSPFIKCILDAAKALHIPTIGIQHGAIHDLHPAYMFTSSDAEDQIMPSFTLIWGQETFDILVKKGKYKPESLKITGQPRTDIIPKLLQANLQTVSQQYLKTNQKIVLFASQPQRDEKLRYQAAYDLFRALKDMDCLILLKPHPGEMHDENYYHEIARQAYCKNYIIDSNTDLYLLLANSDIVVTCFSTVGAEAIYFQKPLVIIDPLKQDIQKYHEKGVAFQTTGKDSIQKTITKILTGKVKINNKAYSDFIKKYVSQIDGKVNDRIIEFITQF